jgi:flagellar biosynthesis/type III secretory pathway chaperone
MAFTTLMSNLEALHNEHLELLSTSRDKQIAIVNDDMDGINRLTQRENKLIKAVEQLESERKLHLRSWIERMKLPFNSDRITILEVEKLVVSVVEKQALQHIREKLVNVTNALRKQNENNQRLLQQALQYVNFSLDIITGGPEDEMTYHLPEQTGSVRQYSLFDRKA